MYILSACCLHIFYFASKCIHLFHILFYKMVILQYRIVFVRFFTSIFICLHNVVRRSCFIFRSYDLYFSGSAYFVMDTSLFSIPMCNPEWTIRNSKWKRVCVRELNSTTNIIFKSWNPNDIVYVSFKAWSIAI